MLKIWNFFKEIGYYCFFIGVNQFNSLENKSQNSEGERDFVVCNTRGSDFQILAIEADFYYTILQFYKESRCLSMYLSENISVRFEVGLTLL